MSGAKTGIFLCRFAVGRVNVVAETGIQEAFQQEGEEIREGIELAVPSDVFVTEFDTVFHIWIGVPFDEIVQRGGGIVFGFHLNWHQCVGIANKEVHFESRTLALVEIEPVIA